MAKSDNLLDFPSKRARVGHGQRAVAVPGYTLYGDAAPASGWMINVEPLDRRAAALDWTIAPHTHPRFTQMVFVFDGAGDMTLDGDRRAFASPSVLVVPAFQIHSFNYTRAAAGWVVTTENAYLDELLFRAPELRSILKAGGCFPLSPAALPVVAGSIAVLCHELAGDGRGWMIGAEVQLLQIALTLLRDRPVDLSVMPSPRRDLVDRFLALIEERFRMKDDVAAFAAALKVTTSQLRNACRTTMGLAPLAIVHDRIVAEAKRCLMYSSMPVAEIAYSLGYNDAAYFTRFLTRKLGATPTEFRRTHNSLS